MARDEYEQEDYGGEGMEGEEDDELITQEDCWAVIAAYFTDKSLVSQQIDSFNEFVDNTMQELVDENCKFFPGWWSSLVKRVEG